MKSILKKVTLVLLSVFVFSCSSDDNSSTTVDNGNEEVKTKELKVIDRFEYKSFDKGELVETSTVVYSYNEDGTVNNEVTTSIYAEDYKKGVEKEITTYTYKDNLPYAITSEYVNSDGSEDYWDLQYYLEGGLIIKGLAITKDNNEKDSYSFTYNNNKQLLTKSIQDNKSDNFITKYKYDKKGNVVEIDYDGTIEHVEYDDKKSPFTNMNISSLIYSIELFEEEDVFLIHSPSNVIKTSFDYNTENQSYASVFVHTNSYDAEDYLETCLIEEIIENKKVKSEEFKYTYKIITVPVK